MKNRKVRKALRKRYTQQGRFTPHYDTYDRLVDDIRNGYSFFFKGRLPNIAGLIISVSLMIGLTTLFAILMATGDGAGSFVVNFLLMFFSISICFTSIMFFLAVRVSNVFIIGPEGVLIRQLVGGEHSFSWDQLVDIHHFKDQTSFLTKITREQNFIVRLTTKEKSKSIAQVNTWFFSHRNYESILLLKQFNSFEIKELLPQFLKFYYEISQNKSFEYDESKPTLDQTLKDRINSIIDILIDNRTIDISKICNLLELPQKYVEKTILSESLSLNSIFKVKETRMTINKEITDKEIFLNMTDLLTFLLEK